MRCLLSRPQGRLYGEGKDPTGQVEGSTVQTDGTGKERKVRKKIRLDRNLNSQWEGDQAGRAEAFWGKVCILFLSKEMTLYHEFLGRN